MNVISTKCWAYLDGIEKFPLTAYTLIAYWVTTCCVHVINTDVATGGSLRGSIKNAQNIIQKTCKRGGKYTSTRIVSGII